MNCCGTKGTSRDTGVNMEVLHPVPADKSNPTDTPTSKRASNSGPVDINPTNPQTLPSPMSTHEGGDGATGKLTAHSSNTYSNTNDMCIRASIDKYQSPDTVSLIPYKEPHTSEGRSVSLTTSLLPPPSPITVGGGIPTQARRPPPTKAPSRTASRIATPRGRYNHTVHVAGDPKDNIANICGSSLTIPLKRCQDENRDNIVTIHVQSNSRDTAGDTDTNNNIHIDRASVGMYGAADVSARDDDAMCGLGPTPPATAPSPASVRASSIGGREVYDKQKYGRSNEHNNNNTDDSADISRYSGIMPHSSAILSGDSSIVCSGVYVESKYSDNLCVHHSGYCDNIGKSSNASVAGEPATADMPKGRCINAPLFDVNNSNYITPIVRIGDAAPSRVECLSCPPQALRSQHHYSPTYLSTKAACVPGEYVMSSRKHTGHNYITPKRCLAAPLVTETDMLMSTLPNRLENNNSNNNNLNSNNGSPYLYRTEPSGSDGIPITSIPLCMDSAQGYGRSKGDPHRARVHETIYTPTPIPPHVTYSSPAGQSRATGNAPVLIAHTITDCNGIPIDPQSHSISQISPYRDPPMPTQLPAPGSSAKKANKVTKATYFLPSMALSCGGSASRRERSDLRTVNISISQEGSSGSPPMSVGGRGHRGTGNHPSHVYSRPPGDGNSNCPTSPYQTIEVEVDDVDEDKYFNNNNIVNNNVNNNMNNNKVDHHGNGTSNRVPTYGAATNIEYAYNMLSSTGGFTNINATQQAQHNPMEHTFQYRNTLQSGNPGTSLPTPIPPPMSKWGEDIRPPSLLMYVLTRVSVRCLPQRLRGMIVSQQEPVCTKSGTVVSHPTSHIQHLTARR